MIIATDRVATGAARRACWHSTEVIMNVLTFVLSGILISLMIWIAQRRQWRKWIRPLCVASTFLVLVVFVYLQSSPATLGAGKWYETSPYLELFFFLLMLTGMAARYVTKAIEIRRDKIAELQKQGGVVVKPKLEFDIWEFSYPLFVSVVTYGALLSQLKDNTFSVTNATLSFQTGFFWQTVLVAKQGK
jgi:prepilin signal peptidase PulO-like enzyme (type II secretory pathway)